nr:hypothetical protein [Alicyclobacillus acidocaldarius]
MQQVHAVGMSNCNFRRPLAWPVKAGDPRIPQFRTPTGPLKDGSLGEGQALVLQIDEGFIGIGNAGDRDKDGLPMGFECGRMPRAGAERVGGTGGAVRPALAGHEATPIAFSDRVPQDARNRAVDEIDVEQAMRRVHIEDVTRHQDAERSSEDSVVSDFPDARKQVMVTHQLLEEPGQFLGRYDLEAEQAAKQRVRHLVPREAVRSVQCRAGGHVIQAPRMERRNGLATFCESRSGS